MQNITQLLLKKLRLFRRQMQPGKLRDITDVEFACHLVSYLQNSLPFAGGNLGDSPRRERSADIRSQRPSGPDLGPASNAGESPKCPSPEGCVENGVAAALRLGYSPIGGMLPRRALSATGRIRRGEPAAHFEHNK